MAGSEHAALQKARRHSLLPKEKLAFDLSLATLLWFDGNYHAFQEIYSGLDEQQAKDYQKTHFGFLLVSALHHEIRNDFPSACAALEKAVEISRIPAQEISALNNLGRLERLQENLLSAVSVTERALAALKNHESSNLYHIVMHNLVGLKIDLGEYVKASKLLEEFETRIDQNNPNHVLEYLNLKIQIARDTQNRNLLEATYAEADQKLKAEMKGNARLRHVVAELRMRYSDKHDFQSQLRKLETHIGAIRTLPPRERFYLLHEIVQTLGSHLQQHPHDTLANTLMKDAFPRFLALEDIINEQLQELPVALPGIRDIWHRHALTIREMRFGPATPPSQEDMEALFERMLERRNIWKNKKNPLREADVLLDACDLYVKYAELFGIPFRQHFAARAQSWLRTAAELLEPQWNHPSATACTMTMGYFYGRLLDDRKAASKWVERFESTRHSPLLFHAGLQRKLEDTKRWLSETSRH